MLGIFIILGVFQKLDLPPLSGVKGEMILLSLAL
jgi:hypothetical protein